MTNELEMDTQTHDPTDEKLTEVLFYSFVDSLTNIYSKYLPGTKHSAGWRLRGRKKSLCPVGHHSLCGKIGT